MKLITLAFFIGVSFAQQPISGPVAGGGGGGGAPTGAAGGALTGTYPNPVLTAIPATANLIPIASGTLGVLGISTLKLNGGILYPTTDSTTAITINKADGATNIATIDTTNGFVGIGAGTPGFMFTLGGTAAASSVERIDINGNVYYGGLETAISGVTKWFGGMDGGLNDFYFNYGSRSQSSAILLLSSAGKVGINISSPTAYLHLPASTAAAGTASLKIPPGVVATTPVSGNIESNGTHLYWTDSGNARNQLDGGVSTVGFTGGLISVANPTTTPALTVAGTSGGIPYFSGAATWASSGAGVTGAMMAWGGAGNAPTSPLSLLVTNQNSATETFTFYNSTATTGESHFFFKDGAANQAIFTSSFKATFAVQTSAGANYFSCSLSYCGANTTDFRIANDLAITTGGATPLGANPSLSISMGQKNGVNGISLASDQNVVFNSGTNVGTGTVDTGFFRSAAGQIAFTDGANSPNTTTNLRDVTYRHNLCKGTVPTITTHFNTSGDSIAGGDCGGKVTVGSGTATNTGVVTFGTAFANAPACTANNETTLGQALQAVSTTTTLTLNGLLTSTGAAQNFTNGVVLSYHCDGY